jgi:hypothetical protein
MKLQEDRVEIFISKSSENISAKINKFLEDNATQIEKVVDVKLSTTSSPLLASHEADKQMTIIVTVLVHYKIRQDVNDQE